MTFSYHEVRLAGQMPLAIDSFSCFSHLQSYVVFVPLFDVVNDFQRTRVPAGSSLGATGVLWAQLRAL